MYRIRCVGFDDKKNLPGFFFLPDRFMKAIF